MRTERKHSHSGGDPMADQGKDRAREAAHRRLMRAAKAWLDAQGDLTAAREELDAAAEAFDALVAKRAGGPFRSLRATLRGEVPA